MAFASGNVQRVWRINRTIFDRIAIRGLFSFQNGNPSGLYVKISPTTCALPAPAHENNPHSEYKTVLNRGAGNNQTSASDFAYYQGTTINVSRSAKVLETNPQQVRLESAEANT